MREHEQAVKQLSSNFPAGTVWLHVVAVWPEYAGCGFMSNSAMENPCHIDQRLTELEIKASFSDDLLDELNRAIFRQQQQIDSLIRELGHLRRQSPDAGAGVARGARDEMPPHY